MLVLVLYEMYHNIGIVRSLKSRDGGFLWAGLALVRPRDVKKAKNTPQFTDMIPQDPCTN